ncbi:TM1266 family iron-only hydrogenase system putative regulator [Succinispira mobilis]|uniref:TM1266 family iron-only hydrogenase system putative regulator n=1 Tax=Succinispira mobilis TaxID=78120 RepID=UPI000375D34B|nr:TM1266 family iron-only hydrogenase system putative regulator [Succinispira mobilis]
MQERIALIGIIVEAPENVELLNQILHNYNEYIIGRMGIPYPKKSLCIISVIVDAPNNIISALTGKIGMIPGLSVKTVYSKN